MPLVRPFFGDQVCPSLLQFCSIPDDLREQYFWANRVNNLGAGLRVKSLSGEDMAAAWKEATGST